VNVAKRSAIIKKLRQQLTVAKETIAEAGVVLDPLKRTVEERTKNLGMARESLRRQDERVIELEEQHRDDKLKLGQAIEDEKRASWRAQEVETENTKLGEKLVEMEKHLKVTKARNQELEKLNLDTGKIRRRLNNAHAYIAQLAAFLRASNMQVPPAQPGKWAASIAASPTEDLLELDKISMKEPATVTEIHKSKDFYTQAGQAAEE
jgi:chromosome segregation ATPase